MSKSQVISQTYLELTHTCRYILQWHSLCTHWSRQFTELCWRVQFWELIIGFIPFRKLTWNSDCCAAMSLNCCSAHCLITIDCSSKIEHTVQPYFTQTATATHSQTHCMVFTWHELPFLVGTLWYCRPWFPPAEQRPWQWYTATQFAST